jgi:ubiquitin-like protein Pup
MSEQTHANRTERAEEAVDEVVVSEAGKAAVKGAQETSEKADDFLAEIDEMLGTEENAEDFVAGYVQKGGE